MDTDRIVHNLTLSSNNCRTFFFAKKNDLAEQHPVVFGTVHTQKGTCLFMCGWLHLKK